MNNSEQREGSRFAIGTLIITGLLQMSSILSVTKETGWIVLVSATIIIIPIAVMYGKLIKIWSPGFFTEAFGLIPGKIINVLYVLFFLLSSSVDIRQSNNLLSGGMFPGFSPLVLPLLMAPILFYSARKETSKVASLGFILFVSAALLTGVDFLLQISQVRLLNFLPIVNTGAVSFVKMLFYCVTVVLGKIPVVLFVFHRQREFSRRYVTGSLLGCLFLIVVAIRDTGILGSLLPYINNSVFETVQLLDAFGFLSRIEILFIFMHIVCITYTVCLWLGASTDMLTRVFSFRNKKNSFAIIGMIAVVYVVSVFAFRTSAILQNFTINIFPFISVWFVLVIPFIALFFRKKEFA